MIFIENLTYYLICFKIKQYNILFDILSMYEEIFMLFNSIQFFTFFIIVLFIYYIIPKKAQWLYLLIISFIYYIYWDPKSVFFLFLSICSSYTSAILISQNCSKPGFRKLLVAITIVLNIGLLFFFKYSQMLLDTFLQTENITLNLIAPIGISFYTFRVVGYVIDVYRGNITAEKNWGKFALYASFFPQIISGPIERSYHFLPQLDEEHHFDYNKVKEGFLQFICGLLKKVVIADRLNILVSQVFNDVYSYGTSAYIIAILFYTMQIYFDFSGYSDMAIGCGKMMGFYTMQNFNRPYFSNTISDFWRRWHISLSSWFKDYLYIPLGGNRVSTTRWALNMMIVFLVSGMWHGSNWTFIIWGGLHGIYQIIGKLTRQKRLAFYNKFHITIGKLRITPPQMLSGVITFFLIAYA